MTEMLLSRMGRTHEIAVLFANTGCEHEETLRFVHACDTHLGFNTVWLEAVPVMGARAGTQARRVSFETASRDGLPFSSVISKYGIPNAKFPHCTRELKERPIAWWVHSVMGWPRLSYDLAIGIRADEMDRVSPRRDSLRLIYPLVEAGVTKEDVRRACAAWSFNLRIPGDHFGNCTWCWKKSFRKLMTLAKEAPDVFDFPAQMEREYETFRKDEKTDPIRFFRQSKTVADLFAMAEQPFTPYADTPLPFDESLDVGSGCGESCEIGADDHA